MVGRGQVLKGGFIGIGSNVGMIAFASSRTSAPPPARPRFTLALSVEQLLLISSLFWLFSANRLFFAAALKDRLASDASSWGFGLAIGVMVLALHVFLVGLVAHRWTIKPVLCVLLIGTACATFYMQTYGVYLDPTMLRNTLRTDPAEASELLSLRMAGHVLLWAGLPLLALWRVEIVRRRSWQRALGVRLGVLLLALATAVAAIMAVFQPFSSLMRNNKEIRYLITPANYIWSLGSVIAQDLKGAAKPRQPLGLDAKPGAQMSARAKPLVLVLVVGETARAANWGLNGYARQTTPQLAQVPELISLPPVEACGTNTETSLPCMFAPIGRRDYDEARIRGSESLLHLLARAGVQVHWRDNQSGCKGVCDGLPNDFVDDQNAPGLCDGKRCLDEGLIADLDARLAAAKSQSASTHLWVMHQLGNHGPSYFRRYPEAFERFKPACQKDDLRLCSKEEIVNAYDNALLYTDHLLAELVKKLKARSDEMDTALIYVSDHGESLGENGLFLHGIPYAIAPKQQTQVPMLMWASPGFGANAGLDMACLRQRASQTEPAPRHDHLFHTVMGLLDVHSSVFAPEWNLAQNCKTGAAR